MTPRPSPRPGMPLSDRELAVLTLISDGKTNDQIAALLNLSKHTIRTHIRRLMAKLEANDRAHAVAIGYRTGLL